ncbi:MAG: matrixin family metalloprotease [Myxococcaceae bacterium]
MRRFLLLTALLPSVALGTVSNDRWRVLPSTYQVFSHASINGVANFTTAVPAVQAAFAHWTASRVACTTWNVIYGGQFNTPGGLNALNATDRKNYVIWLGGADWKLDANTLGLTTITFFTQSGEIFDADMQLNNNREWKVGGAGTRIDVESLLTHEAGHYLGLDHTPNMSTIMYAVYFIGEFKSALQPADISDVCTMYPRAGSDGGTAGVGAQGSFCQTNADCSAAAPVCRGGAAAATSKICTATCATSSTCPNGYTCQADSTGAMSCLIPPSAELCKYCSSGAQCGSGLCVGTGRRNWCTKTCTSATSAATSCGAGYECVALDGTSTYVCQPTNVTCPAPQCSTAAQCPVGYACVGGMCEATGKPGDRCETSIYCEACSDCIGATSEAYCRPCCQALAAGGRCASCPAVTCAAGMTCTEETNGLDAVCIPTSGGASCTTCGIGSPCQVGLTCYNGKCLAACNPAQPSACTACVNTAEGGLCACPGTIAGRGQACGPNAQGVEFSCMNGLACVGSPKTCLPRCATTAQCDSGETCSPVDGAMVCVLSKTPGTKCNSCVNGTGCDPGLTCFNNRCYFPCDVQAPVCTSCVDVTGATDVCACDDQRAATGEACGTVVGTEVRTCGSGNLCVDGVCRLECAEGNVCPQGQTCDTVGDRLLCSGGATDGGTGPGNNSGCGCRITSVVNLAAGAAVLIAWAARRRRALRH